MTAAKRVSFPLYFRIPAWCAKPRIAVNGAPVDAAPDEKGFVRIARDWAGGDTVELHSRCRSNVTCAATRPSFRRRQRQYFGFKPAAVFQKRRLAL